MTTVANTIARLRQERDHYREEAQDWRRCCRRWRRRRTAEATAAINALNDERARVARLVEAAEAVLEASLNLPECELGADIVIALRQALNALNRKED